MRGPAYANNMQCTAWSRQQADWHCPWAGAGVWPAKLSVMLSGHIPGNDWVAGGVLGAVAWTSPFQAVKKLQAAAAAAALAWVPQRAPVGSSEGPRSRLNLVQSWLLQSLIAAAGPSQSLVAVRSCWWPCALETDLQETV